MARVGRRVGEPKTFFGSRAFGGAGSAPVAREPLGTSTHPGGEAIARACAGAWGRDPGRVAAHASATPTRGRVPLNASHGKILRASRPGGTHQAVARVTFSALRRLDGGARGEVLPPTHRGVSGDRARAGRARRPRSFERRRRSELFFSFSVGQACGCPRAKCVSGEKPKTEDPRKTENGAFGVRDSRNRP